MHQIFASFPILMFHKVQCSSATRLRCGAVASNSYVAHLLVNLPAKKKLKIGRHLAKLWTILWWIVFFDSQCIMNSPDICQTFNSIRRSVGSSTLSHLSAWLCSDPVYHTSGWISAGRTADAWKVLGEGQRKTIVAGEGGDR